MGKMGVLRRVVLLFHIAEHHRVRRLRAGPRDPGRLKRHPKVHQPAGERRAELHTVRHVPDARHGADRHVLQPDAAGRGDEDPDVHGRAAEDHQMQKQLIGPRAAATNEEGLSGGRPRSDFRSRCFGGDFRTLSIALIIAIVSWNTETECAGFRTGTFETVFETGTST